MNSPTSLEQILTAREARRRQLEEIFSQHQVVLTISLNLPGEKKSFLQAKQFLSQTFEQFRNFLGNEFIIDEIVLVEDFAGNEYFISFLESPDPLKLKQKALTFETQLGEASMLVDLDVYRNFDQKVSRADLGLKPRKCFLCSQPAKVCAFNQTHSSESLETFIKDFFAETKGNLQGNE